MNLQGFDRNRFEGPASPTKPVCDALAARHVSRAARRVGALVIAIGAAIAPEAFAATAAEKADFGERVAFDGATPDELHQRFIVHYREGAKESHDAVTLAKDLDRVAREEPGSELEYLRTLATGAQVVGLMDAPRYANARQAETVMMALARNPAVAMVEVDAAVYPTVVPSDPLYGQQWHYFEPTGGINLPAAWDIATGSGVTVAVIDTGITAHPDLNANVVPGYDFISDPVNGRDGNGRDPDASDPGNWRLIGDGGGCGEVSCWGFGTGTKAVLASNWHGTHVAGTVAASSSNAAGGVGVAFNAMIAPVRVLGWKGGTTSDLADAIYWSAGGVVPGVSASLSAQVINLSVGGLASGPNSTCSPALQAAIDYAVGQGKVVVAAAGNDNYEVSFTQPANCEGVITVAATTRTGARAEYSNTGAKVDVSAPGGETLYSLSDGVLSTSNTGERGPVAPTHRFAAGTSMAAPHVAGLAALILSLGPRSPAEVEALLKANARPVAGCPGCGAGIVDAQRTLQALFLPAPDVYEDDDTRGTYKVLSGGTTQTHNFHESLDKDWVGYAVAEGTRSTVQLTGQVAAGATLKLYRQFNYPNGSVDLVQVAMNQAGQLQVSNDAPFGEGLAMYYVLATPSAANTYGPDTTYALAVATEGLPDTRDAYEADNQSAQYRILYGGQPQTHTFHHPDDKDWVAYAVDTGVYSRVTLQGNIAGATRLELYRDVNYPNAPPDLRLVTSTGAPVSGSLVVYDTASAFSVYYVRAAANGGDASGVDSYTIDVYTQ